jgi:SAM-dependent methyltransferase
METLNITSKKGTLTIKWSNPDKLVFYAAQQAGCYLDRLDNIDWNLDQRFLPLHKKHFYEWNQYLWTQREEMSVFDLPESPKILDIGCGVSITDLLLYSYIPNSKFYLVDNNGDWPTDLSPTAVSYSVDHPFYNSWDIVEDSIVTSEFNRQRFEILDPQNQFPKDLDLIMSSFSWCFHYPKETYWNKVLKSLKTGGKLFLDVRLLPDRDVIKEISQELNSEPTMVRMRDLPEYLDHIPLPGNDTVGYRCLWVKNS